MEISVVRPAVLFFANRVPIKIAVNAPEGRRKWTTTGFSIEIFQAKGGEL